MKWQIDSLTPSHHVVSWYSSLNELCPFKISLELFKIYFDSLCCIFETFTYGQTSYELRTSGLHEALLF